VKVPGANSPNMLGSAQQLCFYVLSKARQLGDRGMEFVGSDFVPDVAHYELWESLCTFGNEPVVQVFSDASTPSISGVYRAKDDTGAWIYPPDALVGTHQGKIETGIQPTNLMPWCVKAPTNDTDRGLILEWAAKVHPPLTDDQIPYCPPELLATSLGTSPVYKLALDTQNNTADPSAPFSNADFTSHWLRHGAMNAGLSAFYFMRGFAEHTVTPDKTFDFCRQ
jgi:hypothetical protein